MTIAVDQRFAILAKLGENINWDVLTTEEVQVGIRESLRAGAEATVFIQNGFRTQIGDFFRETEELSIPIPALPRPTLAELQAKFPAMKIKSIERDTSPTEAVTLRLATVLRASEESVNGTEYERRIAPKLDITLGLQHKEWLWEHQTEFPTLMALLGKIYIDFSGIVVVDESEDRDVPCLDQIGTRFDQDWDWLGDDFGRSGRVAVSSK